MTKTNQVPNKNPLLENHLIMGEMVKERIYKSPKILRQKLIHTRMAGFRKQDVSVFDQVQQFSFYDNFILFNNAAYVNPISVGSPSQYYFNITDTLYQEKDSIFIITYKPRGNKNFKALKGVLYINSNQYAIQNVIAEPDLPGAVHWKLEHKYSFINDQYWFPEQINFIMTIPMISGMEYNSSQKSYMSDIEINPDLNRRELKDRYIKLDENVFSQQDSVWLKYRSVPLLLKDSTTYLVLDSLRGKVNLDLWFNGLTSLATGNLNIIEGLDLTWKNILRINNFEGARLGLGFQTNKDFSRYFSFGGYGGYGFKDKAFKYGGNIIIDMVPDDVLELKYEYRNDIREPGVLRLPFEEVGLVNRNLYAGRMDKEIFHSLGIQSKFNFFNFGLSLNKTKLKTTDEYQYYYTDTDFKNEFNYTELSFQARYAFDETHIWWKGIRIPKRTKYPILYFSYTRGFEDLLNGEFDFNKITVAIEQKVNVRFLGETIYKIEGGWVDASLPYSKLFAGNGSGGEFSFINVDQIFQTMDNYEFLSDRFVNLFLEHNFGPIFYQNDYSTPELIIAQNISFGSLSNPNLHVNTSSQSLEKGFFEAGVGIDNLLMFKILKSYNIGIGGRVYYRYGKYQKPEFKDNFAYRLGINLIL